VVAPRLTVSEERELRDALEKSQARTKELEQLLSEESEDRELLLERLQEVRAALAEAERKQLLPPGEERELVRLHAQLNAQQLQLTNLQAERDKLVKQVAILTEKPSELERLSLMEELLRLRSRLRDQ
jgi:ribosomal protein S20